jgi:integrase
MKDMSDMKRQPGVTPRRGTNRWQWGIKPPADLRHLYPKDWAYRGTLGTSDLREANALAVQLNARWAARFEEQRRELNPTTLEQITPELIANLALRVRTSVLGSDDLLRDDPRKAVAVIQLADTARRVARRRFFSEASPVPSESMTALSAFDPKWTKLSGLSPAQLAELAQMNMRHSEALGSALARRDLETVRPVVDAEARRLGLRIDWDRDDARPLLVECLKAWRRAQHDLTERDAGAVVDTPQVPAVPSGISAAAASTTASGGRSLRDAFILWRNKRTDRPAKTVGSFERSLRRWEAIMGTGPLESFDREAGLQFEAALLRETAERDGSTTTASHVLGHVQTLFTAAVDAEWIDRSPLKGRSITTQRSEREPWTSTDLVKLFASPLFTAYELPTVARAGLDAAYWLPLLAAYTGARPGELAQLWTDDIAESEGGLVVEFRANASREQRLKNAASWRAIPLHSALIDLGFREYWQAIAAEGVGPLFPAARRMKHHTAAAKFGDWFGEFKRAQGFDSAKKTLHSFRHSVETELGFADVSPTLVDAITGHAGQGIGRKVYGATIRREAERLRPAIERLTYPGLALPRVFTAPVWTPTSTKKPANK